MALQNLQSQRKKLIDQIQAKGGREKAPKLNQQLLDLDNQIRTAKGQPAKGGASGGGLMAPPPTSNDKYQGLSNDQNTIINQRESGDVNLGYLGNQQLGQVANAYSQPFDWNQFGQMPQGPDFSNLGQRQNADFSGVTNIPVGEDFNAWRQQQIDSTYNDFSRRMEPQFKQQMTDFDQQMANRGIPVGSELYNRQLKQLQDSQADQRNSAMVQAQGIAGQNASQFAGVGFQANQQGMNNALTRWDVGNQGYQNRFNDATNMYNAQLGAWNNNIQNAMQRRNMPLNDYNQLMAAQSPMGMQNLGYSQALGQGQQQFKNQMALMKATPRGGGGGGGGGAGALWQQYGFGSPQEYDAYKTSNDIFKAQQLAAIQAQYQNQGPSSGALLAGQALGTGVGLLGAYAFS